MGKKILNSRWFYIAVSVLLAFVLWVYVGKEANPVETGSLRNVQVVFSGLETLEERGLMISEGASQTVALTLRARRDVFSRLEQGEATTVVIDLSGITEPGEQSVAVTTRNITFPRTITATDSIEVLYTSPSTVNFTISQWATKEIEIRGTFVGSVADGYQRGDFSFMPERITISGQEELVNQVEYAQVTVSQEEMSATYSQEMSYTLIDFDGNPVDASALETSSDTVLVTLPVEKLKEVALTVDVVAGGGATEADATVDIEPKTIMVSGSDDALDGLEEISLGEIDLSDVYGTLTQSMTINLDSSLTNVSGITEATVTVSVEGLTTKVLQVSNIQLIHEPEGYVATAVSQSCTIQIRGSSQEAVDAITASQIRIVADLADTDLSIGSRTVPVTVYLDGSSDVGVVGDYNIVVSLARE